MNVSNHCYERYCERFLNITDQKEIKKQLIEFKEILNKDINNLFQEAELIYYGKLGNANISNYYIKNEIVFVVNQSNDCIVTIYKIDFGFPEKTNNSVIKDLKEIVRKLNNKLEKENTKIQLKVDNKQLEIDNLDMQIEMLEKQLANAKYKRNVLNEEIKYILKETESLEDEIKKYAYQLCNSLDYRKDISKLA